MVMILDRNIIKLKHAHQKFYPKKKMQAYSHQCNSLLMQKKEKLVNEVLHKDKSVHKASKKLGIKYSTAKAIVKRFKETGLLSARMRSPEDVESSHAEESRSEEQIPMAVPQIERNFTYQPENFQYNPYVDPYVDPRASWVPFPPSPYVVPIPPFMNPYWMY